jgi:phosphotransferase system IIB component
MIGKVKNLFSLDKDETFSIKSDVTGVSVSGKSFSVVINPDTSGKGEVTVYKKYLNLLDKDEQTVHVSGSKVVFNSNDTDTLLTVSTCQTA